MILSDKYITHLKKGTNGIIFSLIAKFVLEMLVSLFALTPDKAGSFSFMCIVPTHADKGMTGTLTVE